MALSLEQVEQKAEKPLISVAEYRKILNDYSVSEDKIFARLGYLEAFCRNIIKSDLKDYVTNCKL